MEPSLVSIVLATAVTLVAGGLAWVVRSVVANAREVAVMRSNIEGDGEASRVEAVMAKERLWCREQFVSRDDYVPAVSRLEAKLDATAECLHRLEERSK